MRLMLAEGSGEWVRLRACASQNDTSQRGIIVEMMPTTIEWEISENGGEQIEKVNTMVRMR
jgi:hypothetical protein